MALDHMLNNKLDLEHKIDKLISKVMSTQGEVFTDRYAQVKDLVETLSQEERSILLRKVNEMYNSDSYAALGFTLYGKFRDLEKQVEEQLASKDKSIIYLTIHTIRELKLESCYNTLQNLFLDNKGKEFERNSLMALFKLKPEENLRRLEDYVLKTKRDEVRFVVANTLYDLMEKRDFKNMREIYKILSKIPKGKYLFKKAYQKAERMFEDYNFNED